MDQFKPARAKNIFLVSNMRGFIYKSDKGNGLGRRKLTFICNNRLLFRACTYIEVSVSFRPLQATWPKEMDAKTAIPWSSLARLLRNIHVS